jgi:hypothetical protein
MRDGSTSSDSATGFCLDCHDNYLSALAPAVEAAVDTGRVWRRDCGTVVIPDIAQLDRQLDGLDPEPGAGYPVVSRDGRRHAWVTTTEALS